MNPNNSLAVLAAILAGTLSGPNAFAQSAKNAVQVSALTLVPEVSVFSDGAYVGPWTPVLSGTIKTSQQKDLIIGVSMEAGLFTDTKVSSQKGTKDTSSAEAMVEVRVVIDKGTPSERIAEPGTIVFSRREQTLIAEFGGVLQSCTDSNGDGTITSDECTFTDETLQLIQETLAAHAFFFALDDLGSAVHTVTVEARLSAGATADTGTAGAKAWVGKGAVTVEEVRLVKGQDITL